MKNIYTPADIRTIVDATIGRLDEIAQLDIPQQKLWMDRRSAFVSMVGEQVTAEVLQMRGNSTAKVLVFAGDGLCGAYALATATYLHRAGCAASVVLFNIGGDMLSADAQHARDVFVEEAGEEYLQEVINPGPGFTMPDMNRRTIVVDGIFGSEYRKPLRGGYQAVARFINEQCPKVISIDLPSGMTTDLGVGMINRNIVHADLTLTLVCPTLSFFMPENAELIGRWKTLDVPFDEDAMSAVRCTTRMVDTKAVRTVLPARTPYASKNDLGDVLVFAGSYGMLGAAVLCTRAATRSGCGRVTCHGPRCGFYVMQSSVPSAMFTTDGGDVDIRRFENPRECEGVAIGPGIGCSDDTVRGLEVFLKACFAAGKPLILDADALNCLTVKPSMIDFIPARSILTPHAGEFDRLFGAQSSHASRVLKALEMAARHKIVIVLKGHYTLTIWPDGSIVVNSSGTEALATAGSGDVLTGLMAGFVAQKMMPEVAAVAAVYVHGIAGRIAARINGIQGTTAEDIADAIGPAIDSILNSRNNNQTTHRS
ncbi:MAG: NAD(P)H-hydrate dehydratase [Muribaculaceae bacterium]|nr:NAD(P)H-hydrate dehydratase [Muribaculaceae bacterium]